MIGQNNKPTKSVIFSKNPDTFASHMQILGRVAPEIKKETCLKFQALSTLPTWKGKVVSLPPPALPVAPSSSPAPSSPTHFQTLDEFDAFLQEMESSSTPSPPARRHTVLPPPAPRTLRSSGRLIDLSSDESETECAGRVKRAKGRSSGDPSSSVDPDQLICQINGYQIFGAQLALLKEGNWLNDELINFFFIQNAGYIPNPKFHIHRTQFFQLLSEKSPSLSRYSRPPDSVERIFIPANVSESHWLLIVVEIDEQNISIYNSLPTAAYLMNQISTLINLYLKKYMGVVTQFSTTVQITPFQDNGCDCGIFTIEYGRYLLQNRPFDDFLCQANIALIRQSMISFLLSK